MLLIGASYIYRSLLLVWARCSPQDSDGTKHVPYKEASGGGAGGGASRKGAKPQGRKRKPAGGPGRRKVAFSALASLGGAFGSSTTSTCSAALLLTLASSASTSQPWESAPPSVSGAAAAGAPGDRHASPAAEGWLPISSHAASVSRASVASFDATFPPAARGLTSSGDQLRL